ncbi:MAG: methylated-DNA--[protein]-cysteine S-methyltransferase [Brachymonas sp.]|nr:methylated-DNA--[protein]-cysteine S-methyltransferase [Brachymonas sp.]
MKTPPTSYLLQSIPSPLGPIWLAASDAGLRGIWFEGAAASARFFRCSHLAARRASLLASRAQIVQRYFAGEGVLPDASLPFDLQSGTAFQQAVWQALLRIPRGGSTSYGELAQRIGNSAAVRAVGAAVGRNPISLLIPCHRVLGKDGSLTGYAGGLDRKVALLRLEGVLI